MVRVRGLSYHSNNRKRLIRSRLNSRTFDRRFTSVMGLNRKQKLGPEAVKTGS